MVGKKQVKRSVVKLKQKAKKKVRKPPRKALKAGRGSVRLKKNASRAKKQVKTPKRQKPKKSRQKTTQWKKQLLADARVRKMLIDVAGENALHVIREFGKKMNDEEIAKKTHLKTSDVRVVLNKLHSYGLVSYSRSRDKNSGWYSYVWEMNDDGAEYIIRGLAGNGDHPEKEEEKEGEYYVCDACAPDEKIPFETATDVLFRCMRCGSPLKFLER